MRSSCDQTARQSTSPLASQPPADRQLQRDCRPCARPDRHGRPCLQCFQDCWRIRRMRQDRADTLTTQPAVPRLAGQLGTAIRSGRWPPPSSWPSCASGTAGLLQADVAEAEADGLLVVISARAASGQTRAVWQRATLAAARRYHDAERASPTGDTRSARDRAGIARRWMGPGACRSGCRWRRAVGQVAATHQAGGLVQVLADQGLNLVPAVRHYVVANADLVVGGPIAGQGAVLGRLQGCTDMARAASPTLPCSLAFARAAP
jgi:hypothetical protein